jgi:hypothetical protein
VFRGVSHCIPMASILYCGQFSYLYFSSLSFPSYPISQQRLACILMSSTSTHVTYFNIIDYHSLFFTSSPEFHRVALLLQTCNVYIHRCVYDHICFVYTFIFWIYPPYMRGKHVAFVFPSLAYFS